jgi:hypothetical protein
VGPKSAVACKSQNLRVGLIILRRCLNFLISDGVTIVPLIVIKNGMKKVLTVIKRAVAWMGELTSFPSLDVSNKSLRQQH